MWLENLKLLNFVWKGGQCGLGCLFLLAVLEILVRTLLNISGEIVNYSLHLELELLVDLQVVVVVVYFILNFFDSLENFLSVLFNFFCISFPNSVSIISFS